MNKLSKSRTNTSNERAPNSTNRRSFIKGVTTVAAVSVFSVAPASAAQPHNVEAASGYEEISLSNANDTATVDISGPDGYSNTVTLQADEERDINGLAAGEYTLTAQTDGESAVVNGKSSETVGVLKNPDNTADGNGTPQVGASSEYGQMTLTNASETTGEEVSISGPNGYSNTVTLDPDQERDLTGLEAGQYTLTAQASDGSAAVVNGHDSHSLSVLQAQQENENEDENENGGGGGGGGILDPIL